MKRRNTMVVAMALTITLVSGVYIIMNKNEKTVKLLKPGTITEEISMVNNDKQGITDIRFKYDSIEQLVINDDDIAIKYIYEGKEGYYKIADGKLNDIKQEEFPVKPVATKEEVSKIEDRVVSKDGKRYAYYDKANKSIVIANKDTGKNTVITSGFDNKTVSNFTENVAFAYHGGYVSVETEEGISIVGSDSGKFYLEDTYGGKSTKWAPNDLRFAYIYLAQNSRNRVGFYNVKTKKYVYSPKLSTYYIDEIVDWLNDDEVLLVSRDKNTNNKEILIYSTKSNKYKFINETSGFDSYRYLNNIINVVSSSEGDTKDVTYIHLEDKHVTSYKAITPLKINVSGKEMEVTMYEFKDGSILFRQQGTLFLQKNDIRMVLTYQPDNKAIDIIDDENIVLIGNDNNVTVYDLKEM